MIQCDVIFNNIRINVMMFVNLCNRFVLIQVSVKTTAYWIWKIDSHWSNYMSRSPIHHSTSRRPVLSYNSMENVNTLQDTTTVWLKHTQEGLSSIALHEWILTQSWNVISTYTRIYPKNTPPPIRFSIGTSRIQHIT